MHSCMLVSVPQILEQLDTRKTAHLMIVYDHEHSYRSSSCYTIM